MPCSLVLLNTRDAVLPEDKLSCTLLDERIWLLGGVNLVPTGAPLRTKFRQSSELKLPWGDNKIYT